MKKWSAAIALVLVLGAGSFIGVSRWWLRNGQTAPPGDLPPNGDGAKNKLLPEAKPSQPPPVAPTDDRRARAEKIRRDYEEMIAKFSADYSAAGASFPGGLSAFLKQLNLLVREKHVDLAALLTPQELEDLEMQDTQNGKTVQSFLADTAATDEQRRAVFRLMQESADRLPLDFDLTPAALLARETERVGLQEKIRAVLGDGLFPAWLRQEGPDILVYESWVREQGFQPGTVLELWRAKNEFTLGRLQIKARAELTAEQAREAEAVMANHALTRVTSIVGLAGIAAGGRDVLGWLPRPPAKAPGQ